MLTFLVIKKYAFDILKVNGQDMQNTYFPGDALLLKKIGNTYRRNDVVYFEFPARDSTASKVYFLQRILGLPGDWFELTEKSVRVNGKKIHDTATVKHNYFLKSKNIKLDSLYKKRYRMFEGGEVSTDFDYSYSLSFQEYWLLRRDPNIARIIRKSEKKGNFDETCFPFSAHYKWNMDHYGQIYVPKINDTLQLDTVTLRLYSAIINRYEKNITQVKGDSIYINGVLSRKYVVKKNYFFVLGDNRDNANDSRSWGFLPENYIIGKVIRRIKKSAS